MTFWRFLDRNWFWCIGPLLLGALAVHDCTTKPGASASGCGVHIEIGSKATTDGGAP